MNSIKPPPNNSAGNTLQFEPGKNQKRQVVKILPPIEGSRTDTIDWLFTPFNKPDTLFRQPIQKLKSKD